MSLRKILSEDKKDQLRLRHIERVLKAVRPDVPSPSTRRELNRALEYVEEMKQEN